MKIVVDLNNIQEAINQVEKYQNELQAKKKRLLEEVAKVGEQEASKGFSNALYAGDNDVVVTRDKNTIIATGKSVAFIEFGTGTTYPEYPTDEFATPDGVVGHGQYGKGQGKNPPWTYKGKPGNIGHPVKEGVYRTMGNPPARAMYNACKTMKRELPRIAKEVFK